MCCTCVVLPAINGEILPTAVAAVAAVAAAAMEKTCREMFTSNTY